MLTLRPLLASAGDDQKFRLWQVADLRFVTPIGTPLISFTRKPASLAFSPDGQLLAAGDDVSQITLWNVTSLRASIRPGEAINVGLSARGIYAGRDARLNREVNRLAFAPDSKVLLDYEDNPKIHLPRLRSHPRPND